MNLKNIPFRTEADILRELSYNDNVYAWLLIHSHFTVGEKHNYIYKEEFTYKGIGQEIRKNEKTVSKRFKELVKSNIVQEFIYNGKKAYKMPYYERDFEELDRTTVMGLLTLPCKDYREELIKTYAYLLKRKRQTKQDDMADGINRAPVFRISGKEILAEFGHSTGHEQAYERMRMIFTVLQGAGIIEFEVIPLSKRFDGKFDPRRLSVYRVNKKANDKWLGIKVEETKTEEKKN